MVRTRDSSLLSACPSVLHQKRLVGDKRNADGKTLVSQSLFAQTYMYNKKQVHRTMNPTSISRFEEKQF